MHGTSYQETEWYKRKRNCSCQNKDSSDWSSRNRRQNQNDKNANKSIQTSREKLRDKSRKLDPAF